MKSRYSKILYTQSNKDEMIISVIKQLFGEQHPMSRLIDQNTEQRTVIQVHVYNMHRLTNLTIIMMVSTKPYIS